MSLNILLDELPTNVLIEGRSYFINADFRAGIKFEQILTDGRKSNKEKVLEWLSLYFIDEVPQDIESATKAVIEFYNCGKISNKTQPKKMNGKVELKPRMIYSYEHDAPYIFGAFYSQYGIDLNDTEFLHWWKFQALFKNLRSDNKIVEIMGYRAADLSQISSKKERERIAKLKAVYALPDNLSFEDKVAQAGAAFGGIM